MGSVGDSQDFDTEFTDPHRELASRLAALGLELMNEVPFPPYRVDIYFPPIHAALEVDGPFHERKHDERKDAFLNQQYLLPVMRIKSGVVGNEDVWAGPLWKFIQDWEPSYEERWAIAEDRCPWLG